MARLIIIQIVLWGLTNQMLLASVNVFSDVNFAKWKKIPTKDSRGPHFSRGSIRKIKKICSAYTKYNREWYVELHYIELEFEVECRGGHHGFSFWFTNCRDLCRLESRWSWYLYHKSDKRPHTAWNWVKCPHGKWKQETSANQSTRTNKWSQPIRRPSRLD